MRIVRSYFRLVDTFDTSASESQVNVAKAIPTDLNFQYVTRTVGFYRVERRMPGMAVTRNTCYLEKA